MPSIKDFPLVINMEIRWGDMDAFQHVNNILFFRYFESSRIKYFEKIGFTSQTESIGPILADTRCKFIKPLVYPDSIKVGARTTKIGTTSVVMEHIIESDKLGVVAIGEGIVVTYDYKKNSKVPLPDNIRNAIEKLENKSF